LKQRASMTHCYAESNLPLKYFQFDKNKATVQ